MNPHDHRSPFVQARWIKLRNDSGEVIPAFGAVEITNFEKVGDDRYRDVLAVGNKPSADSLPYFAVNGPVQIPDGGYGMVTMESPALAIVDAAPSAVYDSYGTEINQWTLKKGNFGAVIRSTNAMQSAYMISFTLPCEGEIEVVTNVIWDPGSCVLTICKTPICAPALGPENCGA